LELKALGDDTPLGPLNFRKIAPFWDTGPLFWRGEKPGMNGG
jgi:hypothetical protein